MGDENCLFFLEIHFTLTISLQQEYLQQQLGMSFSFLRLLLDLLVHMH